MHHRGGGGGGGRSSSRLRERLARMFRPGALLRSTCNNAAAYTSAAGGVVTEKATTVTSSASACSSSRALLAADAAVVDRDSFVASSRRDYAAVVGRTESFSTALDRLHRRGGTAPLPLSRFSVDALAPPLVESRGKEEVTAKEKETSGGDVQHYGGHYHRHGLGGGAKSDKTRRLLSNPYGFSTSDDADTDGDDVFTSDADEYSRAGGAKKGEAEAFFSSSRSFSSDSSEFYTKKKKKKQPKKSHAAAIASSTKPPPPPSRTSAAHPRRKRRAASSCDTCCVRDGFRPVVSAAEEQVRRGFAVVKRSREPYADFRSSMVEMIVGRQLFGAAELERLLRSYLSLNAPRHHPVILQAFSDIWVVLHGG
ncbi:hypothetical protein ABZP36_026485 [Zizania latifolia]